MQKEIKCPTCGKMFVKKHKCQKYCCRECQRQVAYDLYKNVYKSVNENIKSGNNNVKKVYKKPSDKKCSKCKYTVLIDGQFCCDYLNIFGKRRGCEYGDKCTKFEKRGRMYRL